MSVYRNLSKLILASASPRRQELMSSLGVKFRVLGSPEDEPTPMANENPAEYVQRAAKAKALSVQRMVAGKIAKMRESGQQIGEVEKSPWAVLSADTVVVFKGEILGKPKNPEHALEMLKKLAGQTHSVFTGCYLLRGGDKNMEKSFVQESKVSMWNCPESTLKIYAATQEPLDKAGAYAVQGTGSFLVSRIEGSWSNVVGLPLSDVVQVLLEHGVIEENS